MVGGELGGGTELGRAAQAIMSAGGLVGDEIVNAMLASRIQSADCVNGFLLDGYPRTVEQAECLDGLLAGRGLRPAIILHLDGPEDALVGRMASRRQWPCCSRIYNLLHQPPQSPPVSDSPAPLLLTP